MVKNKNNNNKKNSASGGFSREISNDVNSAQDLSLEDNTQQSESLRAIRRVGCVGHIYSLNAMKSFYA